MLPEHSSGGRPIPIYSVTVHEEHWQTRWLRRHRVSWWAECGDLPGWFAASDTRDGLLKLILPGIREHTGGKGWLQAIYIYPPRGFCPQCAGRNAVRKHGDALRELSK